MWKDQSLVSTQSLSVETIRAAFSKAKLFKEIWQKTKGDEFPHQSLKGKTVVNLFFEPSTRTRMSFELAAKRLGASVMNFHPQASSVSKGETLLDTARNIEAMEPDLLVLRHASAGAPDLLSRRLRIPVVNAGDGFHEHPTQALLDVFTMEERLGTVKDKIVLIVGDIAHSRVARSNIYLLKKLGAKVRVCGPPSLMPPQVDRLGVTVDSSLERSLDQVDVVMMLRVQLERQNAMQIPSLGEYARFWGLNSHTVRKLKQGALIMHPGPYNEGVEISQDVALGPYSVILDQVNHGVLVRMAVLDLILGRGGYES